MNPFIKRNGEFNYSAFIYFHADKLAIGQRLGPKSTRRTYELGNRDNYEIASKSLRSACESILANRFGFKRKRALEGSGYEYLKIEAKPLPSLYEKLFNEHCANSH
ncbi:hypothetical protein [Shewanella aestuarii]|uniref:Uncharacterized protein n=1 Tax=Shewanella aestuarii TaxID=1028752 RepID=A0A6G9QPG2_9GAMM|nr:hypothetical protein [Shewanella aestuarii]QIR16456.1 hypothetical protein HBH39_18465 [Shewanella aestuarii]